MGFSMPKYSPHRTHSRKALKTVEVEELFGEESVGSAQDTQPKGIEDMASSSISGMWAISPHRTHSRKALKTQSSRKVMPDS